MPLNANGLLSARKDPSKFSDNGRQFANSTIVTSDINHDSDDSRVQMCVKVFL